MFSLLTWCLLGMKVRSCLWYETNPSNRDEGSRSYYPGGPSISTWFLIAFLSTLQGGAIRYHIQNLQTCPSRCGVFALPFCLVGTRWIFGEDFMVDMFCKQIACKKLASDVSGI